ncbi:MAG: hypothetical protein EPN37_18930 [Chitinophagaceae bacterium]|nr:MAG: hypothetical protein EPN37_18930 [Chitinophagaceae bacterium]
MPLLRERQNLTETAFIEVVIWHVPKSVSGSGHNYKYSLVLVVEGVCVVRYDNELGKGDHRHVADHEVAYRFIDPTLDASTSPFQARMRRRFDIYA